MDAMVATKLWKTSVWDPTATLCSERICRSAIVKSEWVRTADCGAAVLDEEPP